MDHGTPLIATLVGGIGLAFLFGANANELAEIGEFSFILVGLGLAMGLLLGQGRDLVLAIPNAFEAGRIVEDAMSLNAGIRIVARAHSDDEVRHLEALGADTVIMGERQIAIEMIAEIARPGSPATS